MVFGIRRSGIPRILVSAIQEDVMVPIIDSDNAWIQLVSLPTRLGISLWDDCCTGWFTIDIELEVLNNQCCATQVLYPEKQQSPKSRLLRHGI